MKQISHLIVFSLFITLQPICQADSTPSIVPPPASPTAANTPSSTTNPVVTPPPANPTTAPFTVQQPKTNAEIRQWYNNTVDKIPSLNENWISEGISVEERAKRAQEIRHNARLEARAMMPNKQEVADLQARDKEKYGNPEGPTFEYLVEKNRQKGLQGDAVYEDIIGSSNRTNKEYNEKFGVKKEAQSP